jgi:phosphatidylserine/phosphatidylglycerophosphate/cardiolipin synthase-like enzyme
MKRTLLLALVLAGVVAAPAHANKKSSLVDQAIDAYQNQHSYDIPAAGSLEIAFSPNEGTEHLVVKVIDSARSEIRVLSYSFTSAPVTEALVRARHRGVDVRVVADQKENIAADRSGKAHAALSALAAAGVDVRTISVYPIHHDKVLIVDRQTVELGSFNYSDAAAHKNSENVLVNWGNPKLAAVYLGHFERNYRQARPFTPAY